MPVLPRTRLDKIEWFEQRLDSQHGWLADPGAIGLTADQVADLADRVAAARAAYDAAQQARNASMSATVAYHAQTADMEEVGRDLIATVKAFAETTDDPGVYAAASVPPPAAPAPAGPPAPPTNVTGAITSDGAVRLRWKGTLAHRTFYEILRRFDGEETWTVINSVGEKAYLDTTIPPGTSGVWYRVRAKRGAQASAANDPIRLHLGVEPQQGSHAVGTVGTGGTGGMAA